MDINIEVIDAKPKKRRGVKTVEGEISIGDFWEILHITIEWWSVDDYVRQWKEGLRRLERHDKSCLVVTVDDPNKRRFIEWWLLYKIDNKVYVRNSIAIEHIYDELIGDKEFTVESCYDFIPNRGNEYNENGYKVSEWVVEWK